MAILINNEILHIEIPKTGTTWLRKVLSFFDVQHRFLLPVMDCCPRHAAPEDYQWDGQMCVTVRNPKTWVESMWRSHKGQGTDMFVDGRKYEHAPMFPITDCFSSWLSKLLHEQPEFINDYYYKMVPAEGYRIKFECYEEGVSTLTKIPAERLRHVSLENVSRRWECDWNPDLEEKFTRLTELAAAIWSES